MTILATQKSHEIKCVILKYYLPEKEKKTKQTKYEKRYNYLITFLNIFLSNKS